MVGLGIAIQILLSPSGFEGLQVLHRLQRILSIPTHAFVTFVQINYFCDFKYDCPLWHSVKMINSHIDDYKVVCNCICNLYLQLMLIWMKMKMKNTPISSIFSGIPK
jgi:hypothetical protein